MDPKWVSSTAEANQVGGESAYRRMAGYRFAQALKAGQYREPSRLLNLGDGVVGRSIGGTRSPPSSSGDESQRITVGPTSRNRSQPWSMCWRVARSPTFAVLSGAGFRPPDALTLTGERSSSSSGLSCAAFDGDHRSRHIVSYGRSRR